MEIDIEKLKEEVNLLKIKNVRQLKETYDILTHLYSICHKIGTEMKYEIDNHLKYLKDILDMERMELYREGLSEDNPFEKNVHKNIRD